MKYIDTILEFWNILFKPQTIMKNILPLTVFFSGIFLFAQVQAPAAMIAEWDFNDGSGTTVANSGSGGATYDLTLKAIGGASLPAWNATAGPNDTMGVQFERTAENIGNLATASLAASAAMWTSAYTLETFYRLESAPASTAASDCFTVVSLFNDGANYLFDIRITSSTIELSYRATNSTNARVRFTGLDIASYVGEYIYTAATYDAADNNRLTLYLGVGGDLLTISNTFAVGPYAVASPVFSVSASTRGSSRTFDGDMGLVRYYDNVLDATAINTSYQALVPEPQACALLGLGLGMAALRFRRGILARFIS